MNDRISRELAAAATRFDAAAHLPLLCAGVQVGWLRHADAERLAAWPDVFIRDSRGMRLCDDLATPATRTNELARVIEALHRHGAIRGWRNECYAVTTSFDAPALFHIERAAARFFGTTTYAAHANGWCGDAMWIARRSSTKPIDPGLLDNLVGGGMCAGVDPHATIVREAWEEAGIPPELAQKAARAGEFSVLRGVAEGVQAETVFVFDLELPDDFIPRSVDGEVAEFRRVALADVYGIADGRQMTLDASLVARHFLARRAKQR